MDPSPNNCCKGMDHHAEPSHPSIRTWKSHGRCRHRQGLLGSTCFVANGEVPESQHGWLGKSGSQGVSAWKAIVFFSLFDAFWLEICEKNPPSLSLGFIWNRVPQRCPNKSLLHPHWPSWNGNWRYIQISDKPIPHMFGWWCNNHLEKSWSSSMGFGWHPIYEMEKKTIFETTNQL